VNSPVNDLSEWPREQPGAVNDRLNGAVISTADGPVNSPAPSRG